MVFNLQFGVGEAADDKEELESVRLHHQLSLPIPTRAISPAGIVPE